MGDKNKKSIDYAALFHAIAGHWKPLLQNKEFRKDMIRGTIGMIVFVAMAIFILSLNSTGKRLGKLMDEIEPPPGAVLTDSGGMRIGLNYFYKFPGMSEEEVRMYYKKELKEKKWKYKRTDKDGYTDVYSRLGGRYTLMLKKRRTYTKKLDYEWILSITEEEHRGRSPNEKPVGGFGLPE